MLEEKILIESYEKDGKLMIIISNDNEIDINLVIAIEFYKDNQLIDEIGATGFYMSNNTKTGYAIEPSNIIVNTDYDYHKVVILVVEEPIASNRQMYTEQLELVSNKEQNNIIKTVFQNNSDKTLESISVTVIFYQDNQVVGIENTIGSEVKPVEKIDLEIWAPKSSTTGKTLNFDKYEIYYQAYHFID